MIIVTPPEKLAFSRDRIVWKFKDDGAGSLAPGNASTVIKFTGAVPAGTQLVLRWQNVDLRLRAATSPDTSGAEFPAGDGLATYVQALKTWFEKNYYITEDFTVTYGTYEGQPSIFFHARRGGTAYSMAPTTFTGGSVIRYIPGSDGKVVVNNSVFVEVKVRADNAWDYVTAYRGTLPLDEARMAQLDVGKILEAYLKQEVPTFGLPEATRCIFSCRDYYIRYGHAGGEPMSIGQVETTDKYHVALGGHTSMGAEVRSAENTLKGLTPDQDKFLSLHDRTRFVRIDESLYLSYINLRAAKTWIAAQATVTFEDGTTTTTNTNTITNVQQYEKIRFAVGYSQLALANFGKRVKEYTVRLIDNTGAAISETVRCIIDYSHREYIRYMAHFNSQGGVEVLKTYGKAAHEFRVSKEVAETVLPDMYAARDAQFTSWGATLTETVEVATGYIPHRHLGYWLDFFISDHQYRIVQNTAYPIVVNTDEVKKGTDGENFSALVFQFRYARHIDSIGIADLDRLGDSFGILPGVQVAGEVVINPPGGGGDWEGVIDPYPISGSDNPVSSGGVWATLQNYQEKITLGDITQYFRADFTIGDLATDIPLYEQDPTVPAFVKTLTSLSYLFSQLKSVDGEGSGLDADLWQGLTPAEMVVGAAEKWANPVTITVTGAVTGEIVLDGTEDLELATTVNHTHTWASITGKPTNSTEAGLSDVVKIGGNQLGNILTIGTIDDYALQFKVNNVNVARLHKPSSSIYAFTLFSPGWEYLTLSSKSIRMGSDSYDNEVDIEFYYEGDLGYNTFFLKNDTGPIIIKAFESFAVHIHGSQRFSIDGVNAYLSGRLFLYPGASSPPIVTSSTVLNVNFNADMVDGKHAHDFAQLAEDEEITGEWTFPGFLLTTGAIIGSAESNGIINIGIDSNTSEVNIGRVGAVVNIYGTVNSETANDLEVINKTILLNSGGAPNSGFGSGIVIEEDNIIKAFILTNGSRDGWEFKTPYVNWKATFSFTSLTQDRTYTLPDNSGVIALQSWVTSALENFALTGHKHSTSDITDFNTKIDTAFSSKTASSANKFSSKLKLNVGGAVTGFVEFNGSEGTVNLSLEKNFDSIESITFSGDVNGSGSDTIEVYLNEITSDGTFTKVSVNKKGLVTSGSNLSQEDIPSLSASKISNFAASVRATVLTGISIPGTPTLVSEELSVMGGIAALQSQINSFSSGTPNKVPVANANGLFVDSIISSSGNRVSIGEGTESGSWMLYVEGNIITKGILASTIADGTAPLSVASKTMVPNLNAHMLGGHEANYFLNASNIQFGQLSPDVLAPTGVEFGRYTVVTVDQKGRVVGAGQLEYGDVQAALPDWVKHDSRPPRFYRFSRVYVDQGEEISPPITFDLATRIASHHQPSELTVKFIAKNVKTQGIEVGNSGLVIQISGIPEFTFDTDEIAAVVEDQDGNQSYVPIDLSVVGDSGGIPACPVGYPTIVNIVESSTTGMRVHLNYSTIEKLRWRVKQSGNVVAQGTLVTADIPSPVNQPWITFPAPLAAGAYTFEVEGESCTSAVASQAFTITVPASNYTVVPKYYDLTSGSPVYVMDITPGAIVPWRAKFNIQVAVTGLHNQIAMSLVMSGTSQMSWGPENIQPGGASTTNSTPWIFGPSGSSEGRPPGPATIRTRAYLQNVLVEDVSISFSLQESVPSTGTNFYFGTHFVDGEDETLVNEVQMTENGTYQLPQAPSLYGLRIDHVVGNWMSYYEIYMEVLVSGQWQALRVAGAPNHQPYIKAGAIEDTALSFVFSPPTTLINNATGQVFNPHQPGAYRVSIAGTHEGVVVGSSVVTYNLTQNNSPTGLLPNPGVEQVTIGDTLYEMIGDGQAYFEVLPDGKVKIHAPVTKPSFNSARSCNRFLHGGNNSEKIDDADAAALFGSGLLLPPGLHSFVIHYYAADSMDEVYDDPWKFAIEENPDSAGYCAAMHTLDIFIYSNSTPAIPSP